MKAFCSGYEQAITDAGGIDLQILGDRIKRTYWFQ